MFLAAYIGQALSLVQKTSSAEGKYPWQATKIDETGMVLVDAEVVGRDEGIFVRSDLDVSVKYRPREEKDTNEAHNVASVILTRAREMK